MIERLPIYVSVGFVLVTLLTLFFFYMASGRNKALTLVLVILTAFQGVLALNGFFLDSEALPPRISMIAGPTLIFTIWLFRSKRGRKMIENFDFEWYGWLHTVRIPVELILYVLSVYAFIPESMTFEGRNFDVLSGLTAPFIAYFGYRKGLIKQPALIAWNVICLLLVLQVVSTGTFAAPSPFQYLHFDQPNIAVLYFPFVWLPGIVVPVVIIGHVMYLRNVLAQMLEKRAKARLIHLSN